MMKRVAPHFKQNLYFDSKIAGGVNFVSLDNSYYLIEEAQTQMLKAEISKGLPIVLCMHTPLYEKNLAERVNSSCGAREFGASNCPRKQGRFLKDTKAS